MQHIALRMVVSRRTLLALTLGLGFATPAYAVDFVSSQIDLLATAEASDPTGTDFETNPDSATDVTSYTGMESATAAASVSSSGSGASLTAVFTSDLITVAGSADATANGGFDNPASALGVVSYEVVFSSMAPVDYVFSGLLNTVQGDANIGVRLTDLGDDSTVFVSEIFAFDASVIVMPMETGTLAAGSYRLRAFVDASAFADDITSGIDALGEIDVRLELTTVPEPSTFSLALVAALWLAVTRRSARRPKAA